MTEKTTMTERYELLLDVLQPTSIWKSDRIPCSRGIFQLESDYSTV